MTKGFLFTAIFIFSGAFLALRAQTFQRTEAGVKTTFGSGEVEIRFYSPSIVRILKSPGPGLVAKESLSVTKTPEKTSFSVKQVGDEIELRSTEMIVVYNQENGQVSYKTSKENNLLKEQVAGASFTPFNDAGSSTHTVTQVFQLEKDESVYGLGSQQQGKMVQRNLRMNMVQGNTDDYVPFLHSVKGYGVFWDNYSPTVFEDNVKGTSFRSEVGEGVDYYFMYGGNADGVIAKMRDLTGQSPMFPLWTFGFWQSKERYKSQNELVGVVQKYRELGVPLDGIIQDWQYWGNNYLWNGMEFLNGEFYNPKKMVDDVHALNARMIISIWSSFGPHTKPYREMEKQNMLLNFETWPQAGTDTWPPNMDYPSGVRVYDAYNPLARDIYWKYLKKGIFSLGMDGWWMDSTEPDHLSFKPEDFDNKTYLGSFRKVRNAYPLMTVGGVAERQKAESREKRVFILTRSAFAGQQRYGANTWSGDVTASWQALQNQISAGLNFSLTGIPYWNSDIGGFFLSKFPAKLNDPEYRELYARWLEFAAFTPMMRSHGADAPREIYQFGKKGDRVYDALEKFIHLRYSLLPYIYSTSWDVTNKQSSMMRALMMDFASDHKALNINDQFMFGKSFLVAPVTEAMYIERAQGAGVPSEDFSKVKAKAVYLPRGTSWYDFWTGEKVGGGSTVNKETPIDIIPLYVRAGSIIPFGPKVQYAEEKKWDNLEIRIYPGASGSFTLYEDENDNYNYEKGAYSTITFNWDDVKKTLVVSNRKGSFPGMLKARKFNVIVAGEQMDGASNGQLVNYNGKKVTLKLKS
ncbi:alpha-D-xyloside xylohydrolase [Arcticibacter pallidicorallinus]|uniref:Alpha-D-xyloside xylohydrolase n=1 Tax=Arcticibacter pallidicorallinus TaxID=1259464 RepID=A0A2T0UB96_9SPHI|nr:TIM-barrel domain-containing protein [Arcticibacter pallidicorallinus]PRY55148.1 alpha-D-xyloside xylohydrolase [Arcticibacter pallidicorallinus]